MILGINFLDFCCCTFHIQAEVKIASETLLDKKEMQIRKFYLAEDSREKTLF